MPETISFNISILYISRPGSCECRDSRVARTLWHPSLIFCEPQHTHPKKKIKMILLAILSSEQLQTISLSWHQRGIPSQTRIWYIWHVFLCVDDVGGLIRVLKSESNNLLHESTYQLWSIKFYWWFWHTHTSCPSLPFMCFRICGCQAFL